MKTILFDFCGTIDTDGVHWSEKFWELYERFGVDIQKKGFESAFVQSEKEIFEDRELPQATFYEILRKQLTLQFAILRIEGKTGLLDKMSSVCYNEVCEVILRARKVLLGLQPQYKLGVVSNFYGNLAVVCKEFQLDTVFSAMIDSVVVGVRKPDPAIFRIAIEKLNGNPRETCVIGDSYDRDIVPAKQLGCKTVWLKGKSWIVPPSTVAADVAINRFNEIPAAVASLM